MKKFSCWQAINSLLKKIYSSFSWFIFSPVCLICHSNELETKQLVCEACWQSFPEARKAEIITAELSSLLKGETQFAQALSLWEFNTEVQTVIHFLKYGGYWQLATKIGQLMGKKLEQTLALTEEMILLPVPLHKTRLRERGYNQSEILAQYIARETKLKCFSDILQRTRYTQSQTKLTMKQRQKNVSGAFAINNPEKISNKTIILVDDVLTTGATMNACATELIKNGASIIYIFSAAKA